MVVKRPRSKPIALPPLIPGIERVQEMVIFGVTISDRIGFGAHMDKIIMLQTPKIHVRATCFGRPWSPRSTSL